jgi:hypothetical protein
MTSKARIDKLIKFRISSPDDNATISLASWCLVTRVGSAPVMLVVHGTALTLGALWFLTHGRSLNDIPSDDKKIAEDR